ncbi:MFS transporter [Sediminibacterium ginsengisoli]|uniref:Predicted arabinose efflux permease, MFS family n=1 Tax=Sediminibacterium ginsengisoli TaxID=413434 RepID=A0A1T4PBF0_9BACT|nr:MFS transporter [Sediminibacterium ginsengisoli]SJZ88566.1 Predicted arabinose efflux permease, MFS family [Sediminibacterium ginsengisoli]
MEQQTTTPPPFTGYQKFVVAVLALLQFTIILDFMVLSPLGDILMKSLNMSTSNFGLVVSSYAFSAGASGILAAGFADKFDRKKLLLFFYAGFILGTFFCAMAANYHMLLLARIVTGLFGGVIGAISLAIIADLFSVHQRGRVMGFVQMSFAASQVLGIPIGLYFANRWGWHSSFLMIVVLAALIGLAILVKLKPVTQHLALQSDKNPLLHLWHTLSKKRYQTGFAATALMSVGGFMLMPFGSAFLINNIRIHQDQLPLIFMLTGLSSIVIMPVIGKLSDRIDKFALFAGGSVIAIVMIIFYTHLTPVPLWEIIVINMVMFMGIMSRMIPATTLTTSIPELQDRGAFMSINSSLQSMAGGIAAVCAGLIVYQPTKSSPLEHYDTLGFVVSAVVVVCAFFVYRVSRLVKNSKR